MVLQPTLKLLVILLLLNGCNWSDEGNVTEQVPVNEYGKKSIIDDPVAWKNRR